MSRGGGVRPRRRVVKVPCDVATVRRREMTLSAFRELLVRLVGRPVGPRPVHSGTMAARRRRV